MRLGFFFREAIRSIRSNVAISVAAIVTVMRAPSKPKMRPSTRSGTID